MNVYCKGGMLWVNLGSPLSFSKSCTSHMYVSGVSLFREYPIVFEVKPSKPCLNVTSNHETIHDNLQHGSYVSVRCLLATSVRADPAAERHE